MRKWRGPTPERRRVRARRLNVETGVWEPCEYRDLRRGDIFRAFAPDGMQLDPGLVGEEGISAEEPDDSMASLCLGDAMKDVRTRGEGYCVEVLTAPLGELLDKRAMN